MIEIILSSSDTAMPSKPISWELIDFDGQVGHLQLNYEGTDTDTYDYMSVKVRDTNQVITSVNGKYLKAERKSIKMTPLMDEKQAKHIKIISTLLIAILGAALLISFIIALLVQSSLTNVWLSINVVQLVAHIPII